MFIISTLTQGTDCLCWKMRWPVPFVVLFASLWCRSWVVRMPSPSDAIEATSNRCTTVVEYLRSTPIAFVQGAAPQGPRVCVCETSRKIHPCAPSIGRALHSPPPTPARLSNRTARNSAGARRCSASCHGRAVQPLAHLATSRPRWLPAAPHPHNTFLHHHDHAGCASRALRAGRIHLSPLSDYPGVCPPAPRPR